MSANLATRSSLVNKVPDYVRDAIKSAREEPFERIIRGMDDELKSHGARVVSLLPEGFTRLCRSDYGRMLVQDRFWRISNLYYFRHIEDKDEVLVDWEEPYLKELYNYLWGDERHTLNIAILKTRQVYVTTAVICLMLDLCCFSPEQLCGVSNYNEDDVRDTINDKVIFAAEHSPIITLQRPIVTASGLKFNKQNSEIKVEQTGRGRTMGMMLVTEFAKTAAFQKIKAEEVLRGVAAAVDFAPLIIESSSQGPGGKFYEICTSAWALKKQRKRLDRNQFRFIFVPWWMKRRNAMDWTSWDEDVKTYAGYFEQIERDEGCVITRQQRNWWVSTLRSTAANHIETMYQEYPSTVKEAFKSNDDAFFMYASSETMLKEGRYTPLSFGEAPCLCFWDFGWMDSTAFSLWRPGEGGYMNCVYAYRNNKQLLSHFFNIIRNLPVNISWHVLPHDAAAVDSQVSQKITETRGSISSAFMAAGMHNIHSLKKLSDKSRGFLASRQFAPNVRICSQRAPAMFESLQGVKRAYNKTAEAFEDKLEKNNESNHLYDTFESAAIVYSDNPGLYEPRSHSTDIYRDAELLERMQRDGGIDDTIIMP